MWRGPDSPHRIPVSTAVSTISRFRSASPRSVTHPLPTKVHVRAMMTDLGNHGSSCPEARSLQQPLSNRSDGGGLSATSGRTVTASRQPLAGERAMNGEQSDVGCGRRS